MPFSQKCSIRSSCARPMTSDPDLEAETRFSPRPILDGGFPGEGVCSVEGGGGSLPAQAALKGGKGWRGVALCSLSPAFPGKRVENLCIYWTVPGPGSSSLMNPLVPRPPCPVSSLVVVLGRCNPQGPINKSPSESDTVSVFS